MAPTFSSLYNACQSNTLRAVNNTSAKALQDQSVPADRDATLDATALVFAELFCARFNCTRPAYERRAFRELLYGHAKPIAMLLWLLKPSFFAEDLRFIRQLGDATDLRDALSCAATFQDANAARKSLLRSWLKIRVSGFKASLLAYGLFRGHAN